jgi:hypothetical protein
MSQQALYAAAHRAFGGGPLAAPSPLPPVQSTLPAYSPATLLAVLQQLQQQQADQLQPALAALQQHLSPAALAAALSSVAAMQLAPAL